MDPDAAVTPLGHLAFFAEYLKLDALVADCPLVYSSPNAPASAMCWARWFFRSWPDTGVMRTSRHCAEALNPVHFATRKPVEVLSTLVHEMVHRVCHAARARRVCLKPVRSRRQERNSYGADSMRAEDDAKLFLGEAWSDPIEAGIGDRIRGFIEQLIEEELAVALGRGRYERRHWRGDGEVGSPDNLPAGERPMSRRLTVTGTVIATTDHRLVRDGRDRRAAGADRWCGRDGTRVEEQGAAPLRPDDSASGSVDRRNHLAGTNTRRVRRALAALFKGAIGKDAVSRIWRKVKTDWEAWSKRPLAEEDIVRLILDGTVVRVRLDKKATSISPSSSSACAATARRCCWP